MLQIVDFPRTQKLTRLVNLGHNSTSLQLGSWGTGTSDHVTLLACC
jgi:hypothetical protein